MQHNQYSANGPRVPGAHEHEGRVLMTVCTRTRRFHQRLGLAGIAPSHSHRRPRLPIWGDKSGDNCGEPLSTFCATEASNQPTFMPYATTQLELIFPLGHYRATLSLETRGSHVPIPLRSVPIRSAARRWRAFAPPLALPRAQSTALW